MVQLTKLDPKLETQLPGELQLLVEFYFNEKMQKPKLNEHFWELEPDEDEEEDLSLKNGGKIKNDTITKKIPDIS